jgi:DnaJ-class molecular chaperone
MPRTVIDDFIDGLLNFTRDFAQERIEEALPRAPRARRVNGRVPKAPKPPKQPKSRKEAEPTHYDTLEISPKAQPETVSAAYRSLCKRAHPDQWPNDAAKRKAGEERMKKYTEAYSVLKDADKRREYDGSLR